MTAKMKKVSKDTNDTFASFDTLPDYWSFSISCSRYSYKFRSSAEALDLALFLKLLRIRTMTIGSSSKEGGGGAGFTFFFTTVTASTFFSTTFFAGVGVGTVTRLPMFSASSLEMPPRLETLGLFFAIIFF